MDTMQQAKMMAPRYQVIARLLQSIAGCKESENVLWLERHEERLRAIMSTAPSGSGIDCGTKLDVTSTPERLVFTVAFHHMNDVGMYDGWTSHKVIVTPSLAFRFVIRITGKNRDGIKTELADQFDMWLDRGQEA